MAKKYFKVMFLDQDGKGISTQHVWADDLADAENKAKKPKLYSRVIVRGKERQRSFV